MLTEIAIIIGHTRLGYYRKYATITRSYFYFTVKKKCFSWRYIAVMPR